MHILPPQPPVTATHIGPTSLAGRHQARTLLALASRPAHLHSWDHRLFLLCATPPPRHPPN